MKLKDRYITHEINGDQIMVCTDTDLFSGMVRSNETAAFIIDRLKEDVTAEQIADAMAEIYDVPKDVLLKDISGIIEKLRSINAIED